MKAAVYEPGKGVWVKDVPDPVPGPDEVLVAVEACGVCGSDRQLVEGEPPPPGTQFPVILGHEIAGRVANAPAASGWATGDPVVVHPFVPCGRCRACRAGQENLCLHQQVVGFQRPGGFAEYVAVPASTLIRRPDGVAPEAAALLVDAFATPYHAITHVAGWQPEQAVVVLGTGGLGLAAVAVLRARGGERVGAVSRRAAGVDAAKAAGAGAGFVRTPESARAVAREIRRWAEGGADVVLDTQGTAESVAFGIDLLRPGGRLVVVGMSLEPPRLPPVGHWVRRGVTMAGSYGSRPQDVRELLECVRDGRLDPSVILTGVLDLADISQTLAPRPGEARSSAGRLAIRP